MNSGEIKALLHNKYSAPEYAFFTEVANGTGSQQAGYADAVAYALYPSTGHPIEGFEIKISRSDWLSELKKPGKAFPVMQYCDRWWLVATKDVAKLEEIPKAWGFYEVVNNKFYKRKHAPDLTPNELSLSFVAAMLRRATEHTVPASTVYEKQKLAREEARKDYAKDIDEAKAKLEKYKDKVKVFEEASGLEVLSSYTESKELGKAVRFVLDGGLDSGWRIENALGSIKEALGAVQRYQAYVKTFPKPKP